MAQSKKQAPEPEDELPWQRYPNKKRQKYTRPIKFTRPILDALLAALRKGMTKKSACAEVGVSYETFKRWMQAGKTSRSLHANIPPEAFTDFVVEVNQAIAFSEGSALAKVSNAGEEDWHASAWILERRFAEQWSKSGLQQKLLRKNLDSILNICEKHLSEDVCRVIFKEISKLDFSLDQEEYTEIPGIDFDPFSDDLGLSEGSKSTEPGVAE